MIVKDIIMYDIIENIKISAQQYYIKHTYLKI